jgi:DNA-binding transcriptional regulator YiaG
MIDQKNFLVHIPMPDTNYLYPYVRLKTYSLKKRHGVVFKKAPAFLPEEIAAIRKSYGWTQNEFASALNVPRTTISSWESGQKHPSGAALRLLEIFKKTKRRLMGR